MGWRTSWRTPWQRSCGNRSVLIVPAACESGASRVQLMQRLHRLVEDADLRAAEDLFGATVDLNTFEPKSAKDFEEYAKALVANYIRPQVSRSVFALFGCQNLHDSEGTTPLQERNAHYKTLAKALVKQVLAPLDVAQVKDLEVMVAGVRSDKLREEKAAAAAKKRKLLYSMSKNCAQWCINSRTICHENIERKLYYDYTARRHQIPSDEALENVCRGGEEEKHQCGTERRLSGAGRLCL